MSMLTDLIIWSMILGMSPLTLHALRSLVFPSARA
jgi:hypothetical protein